MATLTCSSEKFFKKAVATASHYGFGPIDSIMAEVSPEFSVKKFAPVKPKEVLDARQRRVDALCGELVSTMQKAVQRNLIPSERPVLVYHHNIEQRAQNKPQPDFMTFGLQVLNTKDSIAEALLMRASLATLEELGAKNLCIHINSIGCRDSSAKFQRELTAFLRKHINDLPQNALQALKDDPYLALAILKKKRHPLLSEMPRPMEFLASASRKHLREVLEFMEAAGIPYEIDELLVGHRDIYTQTVFDVREHHENEDGEQEEATPLARGGRYDELARRCVKTSIPAAGVIFALKPEAPGKKNVRFVFEQNRRKPRVFFIHLGFAARLQSLSIVEMLRKAHVPLYQTLEHSGLSDELARAEKLSIPYTIIMGHKEAMERSVIVRDTATRVQQTVPVDMLPMFLKEMQKTK